MFNRIEVPQNFEFHPKEPRLFRVAMGDTVRIVLADRQTWADKYQEFENSWRQDGFQIKVKRLPLNKPSDLALTNIYFEISARLARRYISVAIGREVPIFSIEDSRHVYFKTEIGIIEFSGQYKQKNYSGRSALDSHDGTTPEFVHLHIDKPNGSLFVARSRDGIVRASDKVAPKDYPGRAATEAEIALLAIGPSLLGKRDESLVEVALAGANASHWPGYPLR